MKSLNHSQWPADNVKHLKIQSNLQSSKQTYTNAVIYTHSCLHHSNRCASGITHPKSITARSVEAKTVPLSGQENKELF